MGVKNSPVTTYIMKTTKRGSVGVTPLTPGSTIGFEITSGREERAAAIIATVNPRVLADLILYNLEKSEFTLGKYSTSDN